MPEKKPGSALRAHPCLQDLKGNSNRGINSCTLRGQVSESCQRHPVVASQDTCSSLVRSLEIYEWPSGGADRSCAVHIARLSKGLMHTCPRLTVGLCEEETVDMEMEGRPATMIMVTFLLDPKRIWHWGSPTACCHAACPRKCPCQFHYPLTALYMLPVGRTC